MAERVQHGTPEGYRLHKKLEHEPCPACQGAMDALLARVRGYQGAVRQQMGLVRPQLDFSARQREWWPYLRARERQPLPPIPAPSVPATQCTGEEPWMPRSPRGVAKACRAAGWWTRVTRAVGPRIDAKGAVEPGQEQVPTIAVAAARGDDRLVWTWRYRLKTVKGELGWHWELDDVFWNKKGTINDPEGKQVLNASG